MKSVFRIEVIYENQMMEIVFQQPALNGIGTNEKIVSLTTNYLYIICFNFWFNEFDDVSSLPGKDDF